MTDIPPLPWTIDLTRAELARNRGVAIRDATGHLVCLVQPDKRGLFDHSEAIRLGVAQHAELLAAVRKLALRRHIRLGYEGAEIHNGGSCALCKSEWGPEDFETHVPGCFAAQSIPPKYSPRAERLLDERNGLTNSFGHGPFHDGRTRDRIAHIDDELRGLGVAPPQES